MASKKRRRGMVPGKEIKITHKITAPLSTLLVMSIKIGGVLQ